MRTRTEIKEHLTAEFDDAPDDQITSHKAATTRQLVILNAQFAVLIELLLDFRDIILVHPELRDLIETEQR